MILRQYDPADGEVLAELFYHTVHAVNAGDYSQEQLDAWASGKMDLAAWNKSFCGHYTVVAVEDGRIVGFGDIDDSGYLDRLYVHKDCQRRGIATAICDELERAVKANKIITHASITAKPFFAQRGFRAVKEQQVVRNGIALTNYVMEKQAKFLTVFAVFDEATQQKLKFFQDSVLRLGHAGTQTMGIPFHISLGSFKVADEQELKARIKAVCSQQRAFEINLNKIGHFSNRVLFVEPEQNAPLCRLHDLFDGNFADGFPWHAHTTIFCGDQEQVMQARQCLCDMFTPVKGRITGIQLGEFFPTRMLAAAEFCG